MREVKFPLHDRLILTPIEVVMMFSAHAGSGSGDVSVGRLVLRSGSHRSGAERNVLFPAFLPWLPSKDFSSKGAFLGMVVSLPFILSVLLGHPDWSWYRLLGQSLGFLLAMAGSVAYISLNFTGSTTFTSRTGVKKEIYTYIRPMAVSFAFGVVALIVFAFVK
jgi:hypothetical protein